MNLSHKKLNNNRGFALVLALSCLALFSLVSSFIWKQLHATLRNAEIEARNAVESALLETQSIEEAGRLLNDSTRERLLLHPGLAIASNDEHSLAIAHAPLLTPTKIPRWEAITSRASSIACEQQPQHPKALSTRSCNEAMVSLEEPTIVRGNLDVEHLQLVAEKAPTMLFVLGDLLVRNSLELELSHASQIEIVVVGEAAIANLQTSGTGSILIHARRGKLKLQHEPQPHFLSCSGATRLRLEALAGISISGELQPSTRLGCPLTQVGSHWRIAALIARP